MTTNLPPTPRVWIGCLAAYNAGTLHGEWIDADQDAEDIAEAINAVLASSPVANAEEYDIFDFDACFGMRPRSTSAERIAEVGSFISDHGELGVSVAKHFDNDINQTTEALEHNFRGEYDSLVEFAEELVQETQDLTDWILAYFDFDRYARDLELGGEVFTVILKNGKVAVFWA